MMTPLIDRARTFQRADACFIAQHRGGVLGHKTGLGKTFMALLAWDMLDRPGPLLIIGSASSIPVWISELEKWLGITDPHVVNGSAAERAQEWEKVRTTHKSGIWLCNYDVWRRDLGANLWLAKVNWGACIADEIHRAFRNRKTLTFKALKQIRAFFKVGMSATWTRKGPQDLWAFLNWLDPKLNGSYWRFVNTFCFVQVNEFGGTEILGVRNPDNLKRLMRGRYYVDRTYAEVAPELPTLQRQLIEVDLDPLQRRLYDTLGEKGWIELSADQEQPLLMAPSILALTTRWRQLCCCPRILSPSLPLGAAMEYLLDEIEDDPHTVVFSTFKELQPILEAELQARGLGPVYRLYGGMKPEQIARVCKEFNADPEKGVVLCTTAFAQSFALDTVHTAYCLGWSWSPDENVQAEGRLIRLDSRLPQNVVMRYILSKHTIEDDVRDVVNGKYISTEQIFSITEAELKKYRPDYTPAIPNDLDKDEGESDDDRESLQEL